jgi:hypothetical protein
MEGNFVLNCLILQGLYNRTDNQSLKDDLSRIGVDLIPDPVNGLSLLIKCMTRI